MYTGKRTGLSNEELVIAYRESKNEAYLDELITKNQGLFNILISGYVDSIPNAEYEDLLSESYIPMLRAIEDFDISLGYTFSNFLKKYVTQHLNRLYNEATRKKRFDGYKPVSYQTLEENHKEGGDVTDSRFRVDCDELCTVEFMELLKSLNFNDKEKIAVHILMSGGTKGEVAQALSCTPATANYYFKSIRKKFVLAGVTL